MSVQILTTEDLQNFKSELFAELKSILKTPSLPVKKWLKSDEVKKILKVSPGTLQTLRINGTLQYTKIGGIIYYDYEHIQQTMEQNLRLATKP
ncbi:MAG: helix-turn-helix domain-containing protein [Ferruginibacter sp.]